MLNLFNSQLEVEDKSHIESGKIVQATFSSRVRNGIASVNIIPLYSDLKIKLLNEESSKEKRLKTFFAKLKIRPANPNEDGEIKSANVSYTKKPNDTFMDVIWLALLNGLGDVVGF